MAKQSDGMLKVDGEALTRLRKRAGLTVEKLAEKAGVSTRTIISYRAGKRAQITTLRLVADILKVEFHELLAEPYTEPKPPKPDRRIQVQVMLSIPFEEFDQSEQLSGLMMLLRTMLGTPNVIQGIGVTQGSVIAALALVDSDAARLAMLFPRFREYAAEAIPRLPEPAAMQALADAVTELRIPANQGTLPFGVAQDDAPPEPPAPKPEETASADEPPAVDSPEVDAEDANQKAMPSTPDYDEEIYNKIDGIMDVIELTEEAEKLPSPEREARLLAINKAASAWMERVNKGGHPKAPD